MITAENLFKQLFKNATFMLTAELEREMLLHHKSNDTEETPNLEIWVKFVSIQVDAAFYQS